MKKTIASAILAFVLFPALSFAQLQDTRKPGMYAIVGGESIPLSYSSATAFVGVTTVSNVRYGESYRYDGICSGVEASNTFVMVIDPKNVVAVKSMTKYDVFTKNMTPGNMLIIPLVSDIDKDRRIYIPGVKSNGELATSMPETEFEWERISDNSFKIKLVKPVPGEYGFVFRMSKLSHFDFDGIYGFTIPGAKYQPSLASANEAAPASSAAAVTAAAQSTSASYAASNAAALLNAELSGEPTMAPNDYSIWNGSYEKSDFQLVVGYVNKSWICTYDTLGVTTQREDFFGDPYDTFLHGMQIGGMYTPSFDWGLGLRTGLCFEFYTSRSKWITSWCNHFSEVDMYIPLHASYRIPFTHDCAINLFGGMAFQWAMSGKYFRRVGTYWDWGWGRRPRPVYETEKQEYGNGWPKRVNWQAECGLDFRYKMFGFVFSYSFGIIDHGIVNNFSPGEGKEDIIVPAKKSRQDKMQASVVFFF